MIEIILLTIALVCCCLFMYWKVRAKRWLMLALGFFLSTSNIISTTTTKLLAIFVSPYEYEFVDLALNLELVIWSTMVAIGLGLILKGMWDNYRMKLRNGTTPNLHLKQKPNSKRRVKNAMDKKGLDWDSTRNSGCASRHHAHPMFRVLYVHWLYLGNRRAFSDSVYCNLSLEKEGEMK